jgi:hypothetical protein
VKSVLAAGKSAQASVDHAQTTQPLRGGIDFDISNVDLDIQTDGTGVPFNFGPDMLKNGNFDGLVPVILNVTPITDLPMFLSATEETKELAGAGV